MSVFEAALLGLTALVGLVAAVTVTLAAVRRNPSGVNESAKESGPPAASRRVSAFVRHGNSSAEVEKVIAELQVAQKRIADQEMTIGFQQEEIRRVSSEYGAEYARRKEITRDLERAQAQVQVLLRKKRFYVDRSGTRTTQLV